MRSWLNELGLLLTACGALCVAAGCQSGGNFDAVEREIRWKEDRIYHLEDHLEDYKKRLESAQRENETLRSELEASKGGGSASVWSPGSGGSAPAAAPSASGPTGLPPIGGMDSGGVGSAGEAPGFDNEPIISPPGEGVPEGIEVRGDTPAPSIPPVDTRPNLEPPGGGGADSSFDRALPDDDSAGGLSFRLGPDEVSAIDTSEGSRSRSASTQDDDLPARELTPFEPASHGNEFQDEQQPVEELLPPPPSFDDVSFGRPRKHVPTPAHTATVDSTTVDTTYPLPASVDQVAEVTLNKLLTGGHDTSDGLGDEGVMVVIEPRNTAGEIVDVAGAVDIAVTDPQLSGSDRDVAHWRFAPGEAAERFRETILGAGMHFDLPWPNHPPKHATLQLHVRYTTPEGEKFTLKEEIKVDPPGTGAMASEHPSVSKRARLLPPRAVDAPRNQALSRQRMARIGRPRFPEPDEQQDREQQQGSSDIDQSAPRSPRGDDTQLAPPAWTPYR